MSYINTDKILKYLDRLSSNDGDCSVHSVVYEIKEWIAHNIEEDVEPVRRGTWIEVAKSDNSVLMECQECKEWIRFDYNWLSNVRYCAVCGAKMEVE